MRKVGLVVVALLLSLACGSAPQEEPGTSASSGFTHGPTLGRLSAEGVGVWARTDRPAKFQVKYGTAKGQLTSTSDAVETTIDHDNTAWVHLTGLESDTKYFYELVMADSGVSGPGGSFHTLPAIGDWADAEHNPEGLFNFRFEFACGNNQRTGSGSNFGGALPTYTTMLRDLKRDDERSRIDFAILNGDWLYEEKRDYPAEEWMQQVGVEAERKPRIVDIAPTIVGVWENYKQYFNEGPNLTKWHSSIPSFFTFDDHEIVNDVYGPAEVGRRNRRPVFRDIGVQAWYDYLGWSNPIPHEQGIQFGKAEFTAESDILTDSSADFTKLNLDEAATLHVHWGTPDAGMMQGPSDTEGGDPNSKVYEIVEVLDANRLRVRPAAVADGEASYSIGQMSHFKMSVSNTDLFFLDTRTFRDMHDVTTANDPNRSMLGARQKKWLKDEMAASNADFFFVISSVNFTIPHVGGTGAPIPTANKDDAWTVFLAERQELIDFWDGLGKPVFVLTGDLHNSFAIKITDRVWEFASGPHNSANHPAGSEGNRPPTGVYDSYGLPAEIRWSTYMLNDTPQELRSKPIFCVVQVNAVFNNPKEEGVDRWVAFPNPQVVFQYHDGVTGDLLYAESVVAR